MDFIHGPVVQWGEKCGVPTPVNETLIACVKGIEYALTDYPGKSMTALEPCGATMSYGKKAYVEHVAVRVRDIDWHVDFFREVLGMSIREETGGDGRRRDRYGPSAACNSLPIRIS